MSVRKRKNTRYLHNTDKLAVNLWLSLARDFRSSQGSSFCLRAENALRGNLADFRFGDVFPERGEIPRGRFKRYAQLESLLKKYRFANDVYTDDQLHELTFRKYFTEQERLAAYEPVSQRGYMVLQRARKIARRILGKYSPEDTIQFAEFGKKSSIGCPLALAYIDHKLTDGEAFSGSSQCVAWYKQDVLPGDPILTKLAAEVPVNWNSERLSHESLTLVNVPKTWKTYRTITPLTLISLFYSYGVGKQVTERLRQSGLDIRKLQQRHRSLVKQFSNSTSHATADLSAASDSLTTRVLNRVLPREWYSALKKTFTHRVLYKDCDGNISTAYTESVLPMGNGCTFPVETLIFYCLIKAIGELSGIEGIFSVYGDDLIYPSRLHRFVRQVFPDLGLVLNEEKTYVSFPFRESCGADFYRGCDVRPFFLKGECQRLTPSKYTAFLYKVYNGLTRRWDPLEIPGTLRMLLTEIANVTGRVFRVPPGFPDTAGIKTDHPMDIPLDAWYVDWAPVSCVFSHGSRWFSFNFLKETPKRRFIKSIWPYYWLSLQGKCDDPPENFWETDYSYYHTAPRQGITWHRTVQRFEYRRGGKTFLKKRVKYSPQSASRVAGILELGSGSISDWV
jgi:hypothetical protein